MSAAGEPTEKQVYEFGPFRLDPARQTLRRDGEPVALAPKAFQLLLTLVRHGTETVSKDELMKAVWPDTFVEETNLTRNIFALRRVLGESEPTRYIITAPGRGYRFAEGVRLISEREVSIVSASRSTVVVDVEKTTSRTWVWIGLGIFLAVVAVGLVFLTRRGPGLTERDTIVIAEFANSTGDSVFNGTLRQGLEVQLEQSPFLRMLPEARVRRTLAQMGQATDARLAGETARELCERTGSVATVEGSIAMLGSQYVLGLLAKNCHTGAVLDQEQEQAPRKEDVLNALTLMASRFRRRVGESLASVQKYSTPLEATTSSLEALNAYSAGWRALAVHGAIAALPFFRRATELDPNFAMAYASLGRMYADLDQPDLAMANVERSWQLRDRASDAERMYITVAYQMLGTGNMEAAQQAAEMWARTYPREPRAHVVLAGMISKSAGRYENGVAEARKAVELDPEFWVGYGSLAVNNLYLGRVQEAENALRAALARGLDSDELVMFAFDIAFVKGDRATLETLAARAHARPGGENWMSAREGFVAAFSGHLSSARAFSQRAVLQAQQAGQPERASLWEAGAAVREAWFGNKTPAKEHALAALKLGHDREVEYGAAIALSLSGDVARAEALVHDLETRSPDDTCVRFSYVPVIRALLDLNRGNSEGALEDLQVAVPHELGSPRSAISGFFGALYPIYVRGLAYLAADHAAEAAADFRKILDHPGIVVSDPIAALSHLQLGRAYARMGDRTKARSAYQEFLTLWKDGDRDIPVLKQGESEFRNLQ